MPDATTVATTLEHKTAYLEIGVCTKHVTHLQCRKEESFENWAWYADFLLQGGSLVDISLAELFDPGAHWIRCSLITKSDLEPDWAKALVLADVFLACPHTIAVDHEKTVKPKLILPAGVQL